MSRVDAKLTLALRVTGRLPDGYHALDALVVAVDAPADRLTVAEGPAGVGARVHGPEAAGVPTDAANLAVRAALEVLEPGVGVHLDLEKHIPAGAGLGGGSADAAAVLRILRARAGLDDGRVMAVAAALGADVPVCLRGGVNRMEGRGEIVTPLDPGPPLALVVAVPPFGCSTPAVYRAWDELGGPTASRVVEAPDGWGAVWGPTWSNDLEPAAEVVAPDLAAFRSRVEAVCGVPALLAGSGSAYAAVVPDTDAARRAAAELGRIAGVRAWAARAPVTPEV
ncbi:MAG: 4-(cytidine 5'-diphospho)-2-C-methyl-D-erythritol kinase [Actinomycetes bacterium]